MRSRGSWDIFWKETSIIFAWIYCSSLRELSCINIVQSTDLIIIIFQLFILSWCVKLFCFYKILGKTSAYKIYSSWVRHLIHRDWDQHLSWVRWGCLWTWGCTSSRRGWTFYRELAWLRRRRRWCGGGSRRVRRCGRPACTRCQAWPRNFPG